jgi:hypothetical protein
MEYEHAVELRTPTPFLEARPNAFHMLAHALKRRKLDPRGRLYAEGAA